MTTMIETKLFGSVLDSLFDSMGKEVQGAIDSATSGGIQLELTAAREISLAIENAKNVYKDSLELTLDRVSKQAKATLDQLTSLVQDFENRTGDKVDELSKRAQMLANTLPFASKQPQLMAIRPQYVVVSTATQVVRFVGNFPWSATKGYEPLFKMEERVCRLIQSTTGELQFEIPNGLVQNSQMDRFAYQLGQLEVSYDTGWFFSHKVPCNYQVALHVLPLSPGKISIEYVKDELDRVEEHVVSDVIKEDGNAFYPERWHTKQEVIYPQPGWQIDVTKPPRLNTYHQHGRHKQEIASVTPQEIVCKVGLYCEHGDEIGIFRFSVDFDQFQMVPKQTKRIEAVDLKWGDSHIVEPELGERISKIVFTAFDGSHHEFASPSLSSPYLKVAAEGDNKWKLSAEIPKE